MLKAAGASMSRVSVVGRKGDRNNTLGSSHCVYCSLSRLHEAVDQPRAARGSADSRSGTRPSKSDSVIVHCEDVAALARAVRVVVLRVAVSGVVELGATASGVRGECVLSWILAGPATVDAAVSET